MDHEKYMREALGLAQEAAENGETPVGCVIADENGVIIGRGRNRTEECDATCHAEVEAIRDASRNRGDFRLTGCSMFVTMEPCPMCTGAIMNSRIDSLFYGAKDENSGSCGSVLNLFMENYGCKAKITGGILEAECADLLRDFFRDLRR